MNGANAVLPWPTGGALRIHYDPGALPQLGDEPGPNRFDDPRPRTIDRFLMRYAASSLRGCLLEVLAAFRPNPAAYEREAAVDTDDPDLVEPPEIEEWEHIADFLASQKVARLDAADPSVVSINDPSVQHELDTEPAVRAVLDTEAAQSALQQAGGGPVHLDNVAVRLSSVVGRYVTQACALALYDRDARPDVIHYRSRHDDAEDCWAIYHHTAVRIGDAEEFSPGVHDHAQAFRSVAELWDLPLPPAWKR